MTPEIKERIRKLTIKILTDIITKENLDTNNKKLMKMKTKEARRMAIDMDIATLDFFN